MLKKLVLLGFVFCVSTQMLMAKKQSEQTINHVEIATILFYDGKYDKALESLQKAKESHMDIDWVKYYSMKGIIALKEERYKEAISELHKAVEATKKKVYKAPTIENEKKEVLFSLFSKEKKKKKSQKPLFEPEKIRRAKLDELHIYLSQAYYRDGQYIRAAKALDAAGERGRESASLFTFRAECYWKAKQKESAINALNKGSKLFPKDITLLKQKFYYFAELKLYQASIVAAKNYMKRVPASAQEYISLSQMLVSGGELGEAIKILEEAKMVFPMSAKVHILLGHYYKQKDMPHTTAYLFEQASYYEGKYLKEASEMYRRTGELSHALYLNSMMQDTEEKTKQKVAIFVSRGEFEKVIGLKDALHRYGLLSNDNMRYALAYAYYVVKDYENAEQHLKKIQDNALFSKATVIRKNIEKCKTNPLECM
ncbi:MAG TPA: tetratricopeptide repeat protein [Sulfurovum sp.]|nr:tetratricopeptide repeat protein [Piscirickettsiaceae bacterium]HIQ47145.1 tetratricopeptide repeat protein [Sulfurovum sp.]